WSGAPGRAEAGLRLGGAVWKFWEVRGYWTEGRERLAGLLREAKAGTAARAKALHGAGWLALRQGDSGAMRALCEERLAIQRELDNQHDIAGMLQNLGILAYEQGDYGTARALHEESLAIRRELGDKRGIAASLNNLGDVASGQAEYGPAHTCYEESLA